VFNRASRDCRLEIGDVNGRVVNEGISSGGNTNVGSNPEPFEFTVSYSVFHTQIAICMLERKTLLIKDTYWNSIATNTYFQFFN
jgi:hypothetical protein